MKFQSWRGRVPLLFIAALGVGAAHADAPEVDTSGWKCTQCPFPQGYSGDSALGVLQANGADARYGRYTGIDHNGVYADAAGTGDWSDADGRHVGYEFDRLGLASRSGGIEGGEQGRYSVGLKYQGQPDRLYDTAIRPIDIGTERRTATLLGSYLPAAGWRLYGEFSHQEKEGSALTGASFLTEALQLSQPISTVTDGFEAGVAWAGRIADARLSYTGSWFRQNNDAFSFANPYPPIVPGASLGRLAQYPSNHVQQLTAAGQIRLPLWTATSLNYSASVGRLKQDDAFLPVSTLTPATITPGSLDGDVRLSHYTLAAASRPLPKLHVRGNAAYDGRDDRTVPRVIDYVVTDSLAGGTATTPRYGQDKARLDGSADYGLLQWLRIGVGGDFYHTHFAPGQVLANSQESRSWAHATFTPTGSLSITVKGGNALRKTSSFNPAALPPSENPLLRAFNYAPRDREFFDLSASWEILATLSWAVQGSFANDTYRLSQLGLQNSHDRTIATTLTWTPVETLSLYVNGGYQRVSALQRGENLPAAALWSANDAQRDWNGGLGGRWAIHEHWDLDAAYTRSTTAVQTETLAGGLSQGFPENHTALDSVRFDATYHWTPALRIRFRYLHERYGSNDWALDDVGPATVPNLLAFGIRPYDYNVNVFGLVVLYRMGKY